LAETRKGKGATKGKRNTQKRHMESCKKKGKQISGRKETGNQKGSAQGVTLLVTGWEGSCNNEGKKSEGETARKGDETEREFGQKKGNERRIIII